MPIDFLKHFHPCQNQAEKEHSHGQSLLEMFPDALPSLHHQLVEQPQEISATN